jgi:diguanylate cyclase (GGDEF)-like protein
MEYVAISILVLILVGLIVYNLNLDKKLKIYQSVGEKVESLNIVQEFMNTLGKDLPIDEKLKKINELLLEKYNIKYSTIVVFDGVEYVIKASNVDVKHWDTLKMLHTEEIFADSISTTKSKYITVDTDSERLPYQKMEFGRAKSAMFFPLYIDNVYIGYWIIESSIMHAFDGLDTTVLEVVRENIISIVKSLSYQTTVENIYRTDKFTELFSAEYLYGKAKRILDKYTMSTVCMFRITNIEEINDKFGRLHGNEIITKLSNEVKEYISKDYIFVRFMGPKFVVVFTGIEVEQCEEYVKDFKTKIESIGIEVDVNKKEKDVIQPKTNFALTTYYKGTGMEMVTKRLEEYIDTADKKESAINYI